MPERSQKAVIPPPAEWMTGQFGKAAAPRWSTPSTFTGHKDIKGPTLAAAQEQHRIAQAYFGDPSLKMESLAVRLGCSRPYLSRILTGKVWPRHDMLTQIAHLVSAHQDGRPADQPEEPDLGDEGGEPRGFTLAGRT